MKITGVETMKLGLIAWLLAGSLLMPAMSEASSPPPPSISVNANNALFITHVAPIGSAIFMEASFSSPQVNLHVDVYVGAILPDGRFVSWVGDPQAPTLVAGATPIPFLANVVLPAATTAVSLHHSFTAVDLQGWYWLYGLVVPAGVDPLDPSRWFNTEFFPFLVTPPVTH